MAGQPRPDDPGCSVTPLAVEPLNATDIDLRERVERFLVAKLGNAAELHTFAPMPDGHAGLTFGAEVSTGTVEMGYILKLAPTGVPRRGSTDIYRQAPLLNALHGAGIPVPRVIWSSQDEAELGTPFICMERLPGRTFVIWEPHPSFLDRPEDIPGLWLQTAVVLGSLHRFAWQELLPQWEQPVSMASELDRWLSLFRHAEDAEWRRLGHLLYARLIESIPPDLPTCLIHGDYQPGNVLFDRNRVVGVIDWDLAGIGPAGIDVGWLLMMADRESWEEGWRPESPPSRGALLEAYEKGGGPALSRLDWYQAFAHFRLGSIAGLNLKLHRNGRRVDPVWERFAPSILRLLRSAFPLLDGDIR